MPSRRLFATATAGILAATSATGLRAETLACPNVDVTKTLMLPDTSTVETKKDGQIFVGELVAALSVRRTIDWKANTMCDRRIPLAGFKISQANVCYNLSSGARTAGTDQVLTITDKNGKKFDYPELNSADAVTIGRAYYNACKGRENFTRLQTRTLG